jgi:DNA-binding response OmpR family regulator
MGAQSSIDRVELRGRLALARSQLQRQSERLVALLDLCRVTQLQCGTPRADASASSVFATDVIRIGDAEVVTARQVVRNGHGATRLTPTEWQLLVFLLSNPDAVHTRADLAAGAWGAGYEGRDSEVEVYISRLRRKLGSSGRLLETVRGQGYRLTVSGERPLSAGAGPALGAAIA